MNNVSKFSSGAKRFMGSVSLTLDSVFLPALSLLAHFCLH